MTLSRTILKQAGLGIVVCSLSVMLCQWWQDVGRRTELRRDEFFSRIYSFNGYELPVMPTTVNANDLEGCKKTLFGLWVKGYSMVIEGEPQSAQIAFGDLCERGGTLHFLMSKKLPKV
jgi:hypothetical protein